MSKMQRLLKEQLEEHTETVKTRPPSTALLGVDSTNRFKTLAQRSITETGDVNASPYNFNLYAPTNFVQGFFTRIAVSEINFPYALPPINFFTNRIYLNYSSSGAAPVSKVLLTLNVGWYDFAQLATELARVMNAAIPGALFTVTYNVLNDFAYLASTGTLNAVLWFSPYYVPGYENQKGLYEMMNWNCAIQINGGVVEANGEVYGGPPTLLYTNYVDIVCENLTAVQDVKDGSTSNRPRDAICRLYLTDGLQSNAELGSTPFNVLRQYTNPKFIKWENNIPVASLGFRVYNDCGYILNGIDPSLLRQEIGAFSVPLPTELPDWQLTLLLSEQ